MTKTSRYAFCFCVLALLAVLASPAAAQNLANNCGGSTNFGPIDIPGTFTSTNSTTGSNGIDGSACLTMATNSNSDGVICFTPQNSCTVDLTCNGSASNNIDAGVEAGSCMSPTGGCTTNDSDTVTGFSLTAGVQYCLYCESNQNQQLGFTITETGDCGLLPVELESFSISSSDHAKSPTEARSR